MKIFALIFAPLLLVASHASAKDCPSSGVIETLVEPAVTEYEIVKVNLVYFGSSGYRVHQAEFKIMSQDEYDVLDEI